VRRLLFLLCWIASAASPPQPFNFAIIGDRTGFAQPGVYQHIWREVDRFNPAFAINAGDSIQGGDDATAAEEWQEITPLLKHRFPFYLVPGNHDIFSNRSEALWRRITGRPPFYSFDYGDAHITVLDNSRTNEIPLEQLQFLQQDLVAHAASRPKLIFFHKPFWLTNALFVNPNFPLHQLARKYGVAAIVSGHVHRFAQWRMDGIEYLMVGSSGGQLRGERFADGWFFHWVEARVADGAVTFIVHELPAPYGEGRTFPASEWTSFR